ncbi:hypothetical protein KFK14_19610 [Sphingobium phenoxybenzoativorans]|uniref:Uncharacterized protein n=1 Tax=Sphingobium phenoxybenzoativorans TaxID=1592790 RepID=A0A975K5J0_9SPHN|nr:hypothetical protein [Sphingobium phenoxybenzoativorans]QUT05180.1 hypothetical protein KFK14_19610 [Sphingobium phenoxybenzoativorans]
MSTSDDFPEILTPHQIRFEIDFAIGQMSRGALREWAGKNELKSAAARQYIVDRIAVRFERLQVRRAAPLPHPTDRSKQPE